jgi:hypothetical protein
VLVWAGLPKAVALESRRAAWAERPVRPVVRESAAQAGSRAAVASQLLANRAPVFQALAGTPVPAVARRVLGLQALATAARRVRRGVFGRSEREQRRQRRWHGRQRGNQRR